MDEALPEKDVIPQLWNAYKKTAEYKRGMKNAIPEHHFIVEDQEREGLKDIYQQQIKMLLKSRSSREALEQKTVHH